MEQGAQLTLVLRWQSLLTLQFHVYNYFFWSLGPYRLSCFSMLFLFQFGKQMRFNYKEGCPKEEQWKNVKDILNDLSQYSLYTDSWETFISNISVWKNLWFFSIMRLFSSCGHQESCYWLHPCFALPRTPTKWDPCLIYIHLSDLIWL